MPSFVGDRLSRRAIVAGQHDDPNALTAQATECRHGRRLDRIGHRDDAGRLAVNRHKKGRCTFLSQRLRVCLEIGANDTMILEQRGVPDGDTPAPAVPGHSLARDGDEIRDLLKNHFAFHCRCQYGGSERMFAQFLQARAEGEYGRFIKAGRGHYPP